ncbi:hypothetical protein G7043_25770 [Lentzea sp. NEAU-D13]|uniref:Uncharacterized protein n=1 Tax=Lentzea alba TaxID=2714351 RepID=A0A7C9VW34_9PSEU|nr:hypothetical protein [Lentzea alba]NGY62336.1 hypothetical protein [Lentzea alba]
MDDSAETVLPIWAGSDQRAIQQFGARSAKWSAARVIGEVPGRLTRMTKRTRRPDGAASWCACRVSG